ncbi:10 kDa chaperonin 1, chloroplastic [Selaginella moellendorffii]|uniref:10 kDa chaperonin 1, chloroplastic n=1 Tax=Selaginella moellendorffii TaxID=88036 RepID=UPI000D1CB1F2|nr:10 kDa chaperonin 1, chloroplastic [Selaginella moellendorffii]|eukprot:XP_002991676.2 10 kDa chaperonin 1, chloroplastic [Selaginella moellendorffii]
MAMAMAMIGVPLRVPCAPCPSTAGSSSKAVAAVPARRRPRLASVRASAAVDTSKVSPQADRVLVRLEELPEKSEGGVLLPKNAVKFERYLVGEVISVGKDAGSVERGQKVMFSDINAYEVNFGTSEKHCFCKVGDLLATIN